MCLRTDICAPGLYHASFPPWLIHSSSVGRSETSDMPEGTVTRSLPPRWRLGTTGRKNLTSKRLKMTSKRLKMYQKSQFFTADDPTVVARDEQLLRQKGEGRERAGCDLPEGLDSNRRRRRRVEQPALNRERVLVDGNDALSTTTSLPS